MITFAITTTTKLAGLALFENEKILGQIHVEVAKTHSTTILEQIEMLLSWTGKKLTDIENVVVSTGPGSFTGVRIAISVVKGIFFGRENVNFYEVNELDALAYQGFYNIYQILENFENSKIYALIDSRKEKVYFSAYEILGKELKLVKNYKVAKLDDVIFDIENIKKQDKNKKIYMIGDAVFSYKEKIREKLQNNVILFEDENLKINVVNFVKMLNCGKLSNKKTDIFNLKPNYLEKSQAERDKK